MAANKFVVAAAGDSIFARDRFVNTLWFEDIGTSDQDQLCSDLAAIFEANWYNPGTREITVKSYDAGTPPNFPIGQHTRNVGLAPASTGPREVALCLSFYADRNLPRQRGRIYLPMAAAGLSTPLRPPPATMDKLLDMADDFAALGGADVSWNVHSQTTGEDMEVTDAWVDDEWDTMRSRGLRATTRRTRHTGS